MKHERIGVEIQGHQVFHVTAAPTLEQQPCVRTRLRLHRQHDQLAVANGGTHGDTQRIDIVDTLIEAAAEQPLRFAMSTEFILTRKKIRQATIAFTDTDGEQVVCFIQRIDSDRRDRPVDDIATAALELGHHPREIQTIIDAPAVALEIAPELQRRHEL